MGSSCIFTGREAASPSLSIQSSSISLGSFSKRMFGMMTLLPSTRSGWPCASSADCRCWEADTFNVSVEPSGAEITPALMASLPLARAI